MLTILCFLALSASPALAVPYLAPAVQPPAAVRSSARSSSSAKPVPVIVDPALQKIRKTMLDQVNTERRKKSLKPLKQNAVLDATAQAFAQDMLKRKFFAHTSPDGQSPESRLRAAGYFTPPCNCAVRFVYGENISSGQKTVQDAMTAWMNSKVHRTNILKPDFLELGIGNAGTIWVQNFGSVIVKQ